jgi:transcriptional regulator GlxA family with amidase domain
VPKGFGQENHVLQIAFIVYDGMTLLDFAGIYDPVTRLKTMGFLPDIQYDICALQETIRTTEGAVIQTDRVRPDLARYNYVILPGGDGVRDLVKDRDFLAWIAHVSPETRFAAVCGGVLLAGAAGLLRKKRVTTHPLFREYLKTMAGEVSNDRIVRDGDIITAGGVTASLDLGLYLCEMIAGSGVREQIQKQMDYQNYRTR